METSTRRTTCVLDCPDTCALEVEVFDDRIDRIGGTTAHPNTGGFICSKVAGFASRVDHERRLLYPMRRVGVKGKAEFERITWDQAIDEVCSRLDDIRSRWGGESIVPFHYGGSNGLLTEGLIDALFFSRLGASRLDKTICAAPTTEVALGMYGKMAGVAFEDYVHAQVIIVWGANPKVSNIHLVPYLRQAKRHGAYIAVVDPRRNFSAAEIDLHLPVLPGTDLPVALSMISLWEREGRLDRTFLTRHTVDWETLLAAAREWPVDRAATVAKVEASQIEELARRLADSSPAVIRCGWGLERNRNGGQAVAAVLAIPSVLGKFGRRGGGYTLSNSGALRFDPETLVGPIDGSTRSLNMTQLGSWLNGELDPPVKALFVYNSNPAATVPNQSTVLRGLERNDLFTVVFDQVETDTATYADILLPAVTFLEGHDIRRGYGSYVVGGVRPVIDPRGESRTNPAVFSALGRAMGWTDTAFFWDDQTLFRKVVAEIDTWGRRPRLKILEAGKCESYDFPGQGPIQFGNVFPQTSDAKVHLVPSVLGKEPYRYQSSNGEIGGQSTEGALPPFPLALISPASSRLITSTLGESNLGRLKVELHPDDAHSRGIFAGDVVRVFNDLGEVRCEAAVSDRVRRGVVSMPKGAWRRASLNGSTTTALCPDHVNDVAGGACFNDARVEVEKVSPA